jgi:MtN3 and saliva related transmembrane protein
VFSTTMDLTMIMGLLAGTMTTIAFLPQLIQTWKSRSAKDVSLGMFLIFTTGVLLWVIYGLMIRSLPIIAANTVTLVLAGAILVLKLRYG